MAMARVEKGMERKGLPKAKERGRLLHAPTVVPGGMVRRHALSDMYLPTMDKWMHLLASTCESLATAVVELL